MKKYVGRIALLVCLSSLLGACGSEEVDSSSEKRFPLTFSVSNYEQYSLEGAEHLDAHIPPVSLASPTRATGQLKRLAHLDLGVFDTEGTCVERISQDTLSSDYGTFQVSLPKGHYTLVFVGYDGTRALQMDAPTRLHFAEDYVPNCFSKTLELEVSETSLAAQPIVMSRRVACFSLWCTQGIPEDMSDMQYTVQGGGSELNALTGYATHASTTTTRMGTFHFSATTQRKNPQRMNVYTFLPEDKSTLRFDFAAIRSDASVIRQHTFDKVPMQLNQMTVYKGNFFADALFPTSFSVGVDQAEWNQVDFSY